MFVGRQLSCFPASPDPIVQLISINCSPKNTAHLLQWRSFLFLALIQTSIVHAILHKIKQQLSLLCKSGFNLIIVSYKYLIILAGNCAQNTEKGVSFTPAALRSPRFKESQQWDGGLMQMPEIFCEGFLVRMGDSH